MSAAQTYMRARFRQHLWDVVIRRFKASGLDRAELARRLNLPEEQVRKMLSGPGRWTLEKTSDCLLALDGECSVTFAALPERALTKLRFDVE